MAKKGLSEEALVATLARYPAIAGFIAEKMEGSATPEGSAAGWLYLLAFNPIPFETDIAFGRWLTENADPTERGTYTRWIIACVAADRCLFKALYSGSADRHVHLQNMLRRYDEIKPFLPEKDRDINRFKEIGDLDMFLRSTEHIEPVSLREFDRREEAKLFEDGSAYLIHNDDVCKIVQVKTLAAVQRFGRNTKWCFTSDDGVFYSRYTAMSNIFIVMMKRTHKQAGNKFGISVPRDFHRWLNNSDVRDEMNESIPICMLLETIGEPAKEALVLHVNSLIPVELRRLTGGEEFGTIRPRFYLGANVAAMSDAVTRTAQEIIRTQGNELIRTQTNNDTAQSIAREMFHWIPARSEGFRAGTEMSPVIVSRQAVGRSLRRREQAPIIMDFESIRASDFQIGINRMRRSDVMLAVEVPTEDGEA